MHVRILFALLLGFFLSAAALQKDEIPLTDPVQEARARVLFRELRCVVCTGESLDESQAGLAKDLRITIREQIAEGKSDEAITAGLVTSYGEQILMAPPLREETWLLWFGPLGLLVVGIVVYIVTRRKKLIGG